jgi:phage tail-like protein
MNSLLEEQLASILSGYKGTSGERRSFLLDYLPAFYAGDEFLNRFLLIFEDTLRPIQMMADNLHYYFHPLTTPTELVPWLATWVNLVLDDNWTLEQRRNLIYTAPELYSRRGTRRGLAEYLTLYTGVVPDISEYVDGMKLGPDTRLGINTTIAGRERHRFTVTMYLPEMSEEEVSYKEQNIRRIIDAEKPAHTTYQLILKTRKGDDGPGDTTETGPDGSRAKDKDDRDGHGSNGAAGIGKTEVIATRGTAGAGIPAPTNEIKTAGEGKPPAKPNPAPNGESPAAPELKLETKGNVQSAQPKADGPNKPATGQPSSDGDKSQENK